MYADYTLLADDSLLHFSGDQVPTFLQGQLTCDCLRVTEALSVTGALCSAQGRVVTDCRVLQLGDGHFALRLARDVRELTHETLRKYAMFSRTAISDQNDDWALLAVWGTGAATALAAVAGDVTGGRDACLRTDDLVACQADDAGEAFEIAVKREALPAVQVALSATAQERPESEWQQNELRRGLIRTTASLSGKHVPQALNYDLAGLLNFRKGCYIGQEVVARLHYKGKSKRRCALYAIADGVAVAVGDEVASQDGRQVGTVLRIVATEGKAALAVILVLVDASGQPLVLADSLGPGTPLQPVPLPYSLLGSSDAS